MGQNGEAVVYLLVGLGLGVVLGMLLAPSSGQETREYLRDRAAEGGEYLKQQTGKLRESGSELMGKGKQAIDAA